MAERALEQERQRRARLANMRHELLAPVTALVGYGEMLIEKATRPRARRYRPGLQRILNSAQELLALMDRLLDVTRCRR
jgi:adenylate cyclase